MGFTLCHEPVDGFSSTTLGGDARKPSHRYTRITQIRPDESDGVCSRLPIWLIRVYLWLIPRLAPRDYRR
jgi:hypothetical protein